MPPAEIDPENHAFLRGLRGLAENAARIGGQLTRDWFHRSYDVRRKPDGSEVTDADEAAQAAVVSCLLDARPDDAIIAEESESESEPEAQTGTTSSSPLQRQTLLDHRPSRRHAQLRLRRSNLRLLGSCHVRRLPDRRRRPRSAA